MDASIPAPTWSTRFDLFLWTRLYTYYIQWDISCHVFAGLLFHLDTIKFVILLFLFDVYWMYITFSDLGSPQLNRPSYLRCLCAVCFCYDHSQKWGKRHNNLFCWVCELKLILYCEGWIARVSISSGDQLWHCFTGLRHWGHPWPFCWLLLLCFLGHCQGFVSSCCEAQSQIKANIFSWYCCHENSLDKAGLVKLDLSWSLWSSTQHLNRVCEREGIRLFEAIVAPRCLVIEHQYCSLWPMWRHDHVRFSSPEYLYWIT